MYDILKQYSTINYSDNTAITDITTRIVFKTAVKNTAAVYYPYTIREGERPDLIAEDYYGDSHYAWVIYLSNDIVDPYYQWPLRNEEFKLFIQSKYGSVVNAQSQIVYWTTNWVEDDSFISSSLYENLDDSLKKYWKLDTASFNSYIRNDVDIVIDTNRIVELKMANTSVASSYVKGDLVYQGPESNKTGMGTIKVIYDDKIVLNNIIGAFNTSGNVIGANSTGGTVSSTPLLTTLIKEAIPAAEAVYWKSVTAYEYEDNVNEQRKHIKILDRTYLTRVEKEIRDLLL
jgi:hypothetical protein